MDEVELHLQISTNTRKRSSKEVSASEEAVEIQQMNGDIGEGIIEKQVESDMEFCLNHLVSQEIEEADLCISTGCGG
ncbi:unnamed protein product [Ilex paraguariensis]|uniref:Uncharacterized protein n=1 Tax=Ilex paraguariensis TaxID=185542 RepID=A0ABC8R6S8_9AQUA